MSYYNFLATIILMYFGALESGKESNIEHKPCDDNICTVNRNTLFIIENTIYYLCDAFYLSLT